MNKEEATLLGNYREYDGTIEFYGRINAILKSTDSVLDLGAGRGFWYFEDKCSYRREIRNLKKKVKYLVGIDVDNAVLNNPTTHKNILIKEEKIPLKNDSMDIIFSDWVLEHVKNPEEFSSEISRVLKPGGTFCARTPHKYKYVSLFAMLIKNRLHSKVLRFIQPDRKEVDIFPTAYKLNTLKSIKKNFKDYKNFSYLYTSHPSYYANNKLLYKLLSFVHKIFPAIFVSEIFVFLQKPDNKL
jgi:SAM-dependent methyltransferase